MLLHRLPHRQFCHISVSISFSSRLNDRFIGAGRHKQGVGERITIYRREDWDPREESEEGDEDEEAKLVGVGGLVDDEVDMEDEVVAQRIGGALITNNPLKKAWKNKYFFASGNWEFGEDDVGSGARVQTCFCRGRKLEQIVRVQAENSSIGRSGKRLTTPSILAKFELASLLPR
ncbi:Hypothetical predicted protein [Prunus dulcis]|uniref:Uncharacterized protein n=1 Tax=Prunus dulcis TaxID=3755 RepID=A0A5E4FUD0_PRUDU|nr:Hypothetical predicted protein [Prunus dulcis]